VAKNLMNLRTLQVQSFDPDPVRVWADRFITDRRAGGAAPGTILFYTEKLTKFSQFCENINIERIDQVTPDVIRAFLQWLEDRGHNPGGRHGAYRTVRVFLRWLWDELDLTIPNPIRKVKAPKVAIDPIDPVSPEAVKALLETCDIHTMVGARDRAIILFLLDTGVRMSEALAIDLLDIDLGLGAVLIRVGKGRKPRNVYFGKTTRRALRLYLKFRGMQPGPLWMNANGDRLAKWGFANIFRRRAALAGIEPPSPHDFRRAFALAMLRAGVDVLSLQKLMGHSSLQVLQRYVKQTDLDGQRAHEKGSPVENM